jgi:Spy/CpxP family protein refolding chaperone
MKILKPFRVFLTLALALCSTVAFAQGQDRRPNAPDHGRKSNLQKCLTVVELTDAQKTQVQAVMEAARPELEALHEKMVADRQALRSAIEATPKDSCAIGTAFVQVEADRKAIRSERDEVRAAVLALLTAEQKAKLEGCLEAPRGGRARD